MPYKDKEKERERNIRRRKTEKYKSYQREYQKKWRKENKDKWKKIRNKSEARTERKEYLRKWQRESPKFKEIKKRFKESGRMREWEDKRKKEDLGFLISKRVRTRIKDAFKKYIKNKSIDSLKSSDEYGVDYQEIIKELTKNLPENFNYRNYHIDHINPLCLFDLKNKEELKKAFAPENHQWLSIEEHKNKTKLDIQKFKKWKT